MANNIILFSLVSVFLCLFVQADAQTTQDCSLKKFIECSKEVDKMTVSNACMQLNVSKTCMEELLTGCGKTPPLCMDLPSIQGTRCDIMDGGTWIPMSNERGHESSCRIYDELRLCEVNHCGTRGDKFQGKPVRALDQCAIDKRDECLTPVQGLTQVTQQSCIDVGKAKNCYLSKVYFCQGPRLQLFSAKLIATGLAWHVAECKKKNFGFSQGAGLCVPNAVDVVIDDDVEEMIDRTVVRQLTKDRCNKIFAADKKLANYIDQCEATASSWNVNVLKNIGVALAPWNSSCTDAAADGYPDDKGSASALFNGPNLALQLLVASLLVFAFSNTKY